MIQKTPFVIEIKNSREQNVGGCSSVSNEGLARSGFRAAAKGAWCLSLRQSFPDARKMPPTITVRQLGH
jgi:hypothetical protein